MSISNIRKSRAETPPTVSESRRALRHPASRGLRVRSYGTLFDFASAARACPGAPGEAADRLTALWRDIGVIEPAYRLLVMRMAILSYLKGRAATFAEPSADVQRGAERCPRRQPTERIIDR